ncbi:hypothetical protein Hdeb2414_s0866g00955591 [Helianthus debilis subsp. tardiflorus]
MYMAANTPTFFVHFLQKSILVSIEFKVFLKKKSKVVFTLQLPSWSSCQWDEVVSVTLWDDMQRTCSPFAS